MTRALAGLVGAAVAVLGLAALAMPPEAGVAWRVGYVALHAAAAFGVWWSLRGATLSSSWVLAGALALRLLVLPEPPTLSDDGYRYLWDGLITLEADASPYAARPSDPSLARWHAEPVYTAMNSPDYYSVYPPASQGVFALAATVYRIGGWLASWWLLKALLVAAEMVGIVALLRAMGPSRAAMYAWCPLSVLEIAGQGHTEGLVVGGLGLLLWTGRGRWAAPTGAVVAGLTKLYPVALLPAALRRGGWSGLAMASVATVALALPFWSPVALAHGAESVTLFLGTLDTFSLLYRALKAFLYPWLGDTSGAAASRALAVGWAIAVVGVWLHDDGTRRALLQSLAVVVIGSVLVTTTLHPWYLVPALYVAMTVRSPALRRAVMWLAAVAPCSYLVLVAPWLDLPLLLVGWGGAALLYAVSGHGAAAWSTESTVAVRASSQTASG